MHGWQKSDKKVHCVVLTNLAVIPGLHANIFSVTCAQKRFQVKSESETLILKKFFTEIRFDKKMANKYGKGFILTTRFYKSANNATVLYP